MTALVKVIAGEEDLGPQRFCRRCAAWWPFDTEFWQTIRSDRNKSYACRACGRANNRVAYEQRKARHIWASKLPTIQCETPGCPLVIPNDGRRWCYYDTKTRQLELANGALQPG